MNRPHRPAYRFCRVRLPFPAVLLTQQLKSAEHQVPHAGQLIIAVFPDFRNIIAIPQVRLAILFTLRYQSIH
ncbi:TPA: hypothetical protein NHU23_002242 [Citrobacter freundii]|nr:hypothetical protein [Citrobacter freundii]